MWDAVLLFLVLWIVGSVVVGFGVVGLAAVSFWWHERHALRPGAAGDAP